MKVILSCIVLFFLLGCKKSDSELVIGIWQNGNDWFDIQQNNVYSTGTGPMTSFENLKYVIDENKKQLTFYTNTDSKVFYMNYVLKHNDSLQLQNTMDNSLPIVFFRTKNKPTGFF
jgi:hypothetical protein